MIRPWWRRLLDVEVIQFCASQEALCAKRLQEAMPVSVIRNRGYGERLESRLYVSLTTGG